jgi:hypothetical protein
MSSTAAAASALTTLVGLRRVDWVRLVVGEGCVSAEAVGVGYRLPVS